MFLKSSLRSVSMSNFPLPHVRRDGDDLAVIEVLFQPGDNDGSIQPARISQHNFF
jgi:hypothetical protein